MAVKRGKVPAWTDAEKSKLMELYITTAMSYREIGKQLNRSQDAIYHMIRKIRLETK